MPRKARVEFPGAVYHLLDEDCRESKTDPIWPRSVLVNARFTFRRIWIFYVLLFGMLVLNLAVRPEALLLQNAIARYVIASSLIFAPVFLANVIFSNSFRETERADVAFASNLLGIMVGGMLEYFSMLVGYHMLLVAVIAFYFLAMMLRGRAKMLVSDV